MKELKCLNTHPCSCPNTGCPRHGKCCDCVAFHRDEQNNTPNCFRIAAEAKQQQFLPLTSEN